MSRFYVGQRVRCVSYPSGCGPETTKVRIGDECVIAGTVTHPNRGFHLYEDRDVSVLHDAYKARGPMMAPSYCFEPITDCYDTTSWDECAWKPEHMRAAA